MKIGIIGSGAVARALGTGFLKHGHDVTLGTRTLTNLDDWQREHPAGRIGSFAEAAAYGEAVVLAVRGAVATAALQAAGPENLAGKTVIDATNPLADAPPEHGVLRFFTDRDESLLELLQRDFPDARFVKAFNSVGSALMVDPGFPDGRPTMFICGNDGNAKAVVTRILDQFGWEAADMGRAEAARAIEPLCILWCIPGFLHGQWAHAFKLLVRP